jgi:hypothetical protein
MAKYKITAYIEKDFGDFIDNAEYEKLESKFLDKLENKLYNIGLEEIECRKED